MEWNSDIDEIRTAIRAGQYPNEAAVSKGIILRLLQRLGWPIFDPTIVWPEFSLDTLYVDYALCHPPKKPAVIVEVKAIGKIQGADTQLFEYAFHAGVPIAVLTDGQEWHFYLPAGKGTIPERRFYKLDILERELAEISTRLERYLKYERVRSGEAFKAAQADHDSTMIHETIKQTIPIAWSKLLEEQDSILVDLISEKVADMCGYKPEPDIVSEYLALIAKPGSHPVPPLQKPKPTREPRRAGGIGFTINGIFTPARSAADVLLSVLKRLSESDPAFLSRFAARKHGRSRRYIAPSREELYPGRPDLMQYSKQLPSGWWVGTNYSKINIRQIIELACEVAGLAFGSTLSIELGE